MPKTKDEERWERERKEDAAFHIGKLQSSDPLEIIAACNALNDLKAKEAIEPLRKLKDNSKINIRAAALTAAEAIEKS